MVLTALLVTLVVIALAFIGGWIVQAGKRSRGAPGQGSAAPTPLGIGIGFVTNFFDTLGIGLYAPCMIMVALLGMDPKAAFPIMMGSCAFLMPVGSLQFIRLGSYDLRAAVGLAIGGIPAVLIAAYVVRELPLDVVRWLVLVVVIYTAAMLLRAAQAKPADPTGR
jgi:uncharacterized membrane protein YfcA